MKWPDHDEPPACSRLHAWLNGQDAQRLDPSTANEHSAGLLESAERALFTARRPLIWLESVDVPVARAARYLANILRATLHVAQSPGAEVVASVASADGWFGTSLAEVASTATLIIHIGSSHLTEAPMLGSRYFNEAAEHVFLGSCPEPALDERTSSDNVTQLQWSKEQWLDGLSRTLLMMCDDSTALKRPAEPLDADASYLAELLLSNNYSVWLWNEDELSDEIDRLIVQRVQELARHVSQSRRSMALALALDPGRVTAKDTILWLTNHTTPIRLRDTGWQKDRTPHRSLQEWRDAYDWILCVRNLPSDRLLPDMPFDFVIDAHCNSRTTNSLDSHNRHVWVQAVGLDTSGHLMRGDHGLAAFVPAVQNAQHEIYPHAADVLTRFTKALDAHEAYYRSHRRQAVDSAGNPRAKEVR